MSGETICALASGMGGAIAVIRVSGADAISHTDRIFRSASGKSLVAAKASHLYFGNIVDETGNTVDEVLVSIFRAPHSYTGEDAVEISCHSSRYIISKILELLKREGCRQAEPGEYTKRAFLNGKMDLSQAEAVADLIASSSAMQHRVAMNQMRGAFSNELSELSEKLLRMTTLLELELDFSEEDVEFANRQQLLDLAMQIEQKIQHLIDSFRLGNVLKNGVPVAIIGAPNVGKSTLLNQLVHEDKAIVSAIQGTTRDIIEDTVQIQGYTFRFLDTAGIRSTSDTIEQLGIERSLHAVSQAQIVLLITEPGIPYPDVTTADTQTVIRVVNKADKLPQSAKPEDESYIYISALNGVGIDVLEQKLVDALPSFGATDVIVTSQRHIDSLTSALTYLRTSRQAIENELPGDLIAEDLRTSIYHLSSIIGTSLLDPETTLQSIFQGFCIGK